MLYNGRDDVVSVITHPVGSKVGFNRYLMLSRLGVGDVVEECCSGMLW